MGFLNKPMMAASCRAMGGMRRMQLQAAGCMLLLPNKCCSCQTREQMPGQRMSAGVRRAWLPQLAALLVVIASPAQPQLPASPAVTPTTRLRPGAAGTPLQRSAIWINYADPQTAATSFRDVRGSRVEWRLEVTELERRRDEMYILGRAEPSLVGVVGTWYKPIRDQRIANFVTRGAGGSTWDDHNASSGPLFDIMLRVPQSAGSEIWQRAVGLWPGQHVYAGGVLVAGPWPALIDVQHLCTSYDALRHAKLLPPRMELLRRAEEERSQDEAARLAEEQEWGLAENSLTWADSMVWGQRCDGDCSNGRGRSILPDGEVYQGSFKNDERHGRGLRKWPDNTSYDGQYQKGLRHGVGLYAWPDGTRYEGQWREHTRDGFGVHTYADGTRYEGEFREGLMHGFGIYTSSTSDGYQRRYEGGWKHDAPSGFGVETKMAGLEDSAGSSRYEGEWVDGFRQGRGIELWPDGRKYEGDWLEDAMHGEGITSTAQGESYRGQSNQGHFDGHGHYIYSDGSEYIGSWSDGVRSGAGTFVWPNGEKYNGSWSEHKRNGRGKYEWPDGRSFEGGYVDDLRTGHGLMEWPDGTRYEGEWRDDLPNGRGVFALPAGEVYDGSFKDGKMHGKGVMRWPREKVAGSEAAESWGMSQHWTALGSSGSVPGIIMRMAAAKGPQYDGEWYEDKRHGHGVMEWPDGRRYDGEWVADQMVDPSMLTQDGKSEGEGEGEL